MLWHARWGQQAQIVFSARVGVDLHTYITYPIEANRDTYDEYCGQLKGSFVTQRSLIVCVTLNDNNNEYVYFSNVLACIFIYPGMKYHRIILDLLDKSFKLHLVPQRHHGANST